MSQAEMLATVYGDYISLISCLAIFNGASQKLEKKIYTFDEAIALR